MKSFLKKNRIVVASGLVLAAIAWIGIDSIFAQGTPRSATLSGFVDSRQASGAYVLSISANDDPVKATFFLTNTRTNERSSVVAECIVDGASSVRMGTCVKVIGTLPMSSGTYVINGRVTYGDGMDIVSNQISVNVPLPVIVPVEVPTVEPIVVPVITPRPAVKTKPVEPKPAPVVKPVTVFGQAITNIRSQNNTPQQQAALAAPLILEMNNIALDLRGGERDIASAKERLETLQSEFWEGTDMTSEEAQKNTQYQNAKEYGTTVDGSVMRIIDISVSTTTREIIVSSTSTNAKGEQVVRNEKKKIIVEKVTLNGNALPNMYVTIYIYGEASAIGVVVVGTDGKWTYKLNKTLPDGRYDAYATISERMGKIIAKSQRFGFIKKGEVVSVEQIDLGSDKASSTEPVQPIQEGGLSSGVLIAMAILGVVFLSGAAFAVRFIIKRRQHML